MRVLVCAVLFALVAAEPPSYRQFKVDFEIDDEPKFNENKEEATMGGEKPPYPVAGLKPFREFRLPHRFEKLRLPFSRSELPMRENHLFRKTSKPETHYGFPEAENERKEDDDNKEHEQRTNAIRNSYEVPVHHHHPPTEYGTPEKEEIDERKNFENDHESSKESKDLRKSSEVKIDESTENSDKEENQELQKNEKYTENNVEVNEQGKLRSKDENRRQEWQRKTERYTENNVDIHEEGNIHSKESNEERGQDEEKKTETENTNNKEESQKDSTDDDVKRPGPFYILVPSSPNFEIPYQKQIPLPSVYEGIPFQSQTDFSNIGYSSFYQQRAIDRTPFSYYYQPKFQQSPYISPYSGNQWTNQW